MPLPAATPARPPSRTARRLLAITSLGLAGLLAGLLSGCGTGTLPGSSNNNYAQASGNWQFSSTSAAAAHLSTLGGSLSLSGTEVSGVLHPLSASNQCLSTSTALAVTGSVDPTGQLNLTSPVAGGTLTLSGTFAQDRRSLNAATYIVTGGACAFPASQTANQTLIATTIHPNDASTPVTAQQYLPVSGTYTGTLTTAEGEHFNLTSTLSQITQPDGDGVYHVTGTAGSPGNMCVPGSLSATASTIDGGNISTTYTDSATGTTITGTGTTSPDAVTISISNWIINSPCGSDTGSGTLTRK